MTSTTNTLSRIATIGAVVIVGLARPFPANTRPAPIPGTEDTFQLTKDSTLVCKGTVLEVSRDVAKSQNVTAEEGITARFRPQRCFKGTPKDSVVVVAFSGPAVEKGEYLLLFLKSSGQVYVPSNPYFPKFAVSHQIPIIPPTVTDPQRRLEADLSQTLSPETEAIQITQIELLGGMRTLTDDMPLLSLAKVANARVRGTAYIALLRLSDYSLLRQIGTFVLETAHDLSLQWLRSRIVQCIAQISAISDPSTLTQIEEFTQSADAGLRNAAVKALRQIQRPESVPFLVARLDDSRVETQYVSLMALGQIEKRGVGWAPAYSLFLKDPKQYVDRWKQWWDVQGRQKYPVKKAK